MDKLTLTAPAALVWSLFVVTACSSEPAATGDHAYDDSATADDDETSDDTDREPTSSKDAGKATSKDAGGSKIDAGAGRPKDAGASADAGNAADSGLGDRGMNPGSSIDAGESHDAGSGTNDGGVSGAGSCSVSTPHGCYVPQSDNPMGCPLQIHEQSAFYPPIEEWVECSSPFYTPCNYTKPTGGEPAHCECDLGLHWLCTY